MWKLCVAAVVALLLAGCSTDGEKLDLLETTPFVDVELSTGERTRHHVSGDTGNVLTNRYTKPSYATVSQWYAPRDGYDVEQVLGELLEFAAVNGWEFERAEYGSRWTYSGRYEYRSGWFGVKRVTVRASTGTYTDLDGSEYVSFSIRA